MHTGRELENIEDEPSGIKVKKGQSLFARYKVPIIIISVILILALIGAIVAAFVLSKQTDITVDST